MIINLTDFYDVGKITHWTTSVGVSMYDIELISKSTGEVITWSFTEEYFDKFLDELEEEDKPEWLIYENVKGMLSSNRGFDYLSILCELDRGGYDTEWQVFNSKDYGVPQNRERVYTIGHFRKRGVRKIFPVSATNGENPVRIAQIGYDGSRERRNPDTFRVYDVGGVSPTLTTMERGNCEPHIPIILGGQ
jgi:DNA (cytosine-5)-methyltransferase 1